jgi:hypothetical protein
MNAVHEPRNHIGLMSIFRKEFRDGMVTGEGGTMTNSLPACSAFLFAAVILLVAPLCVAGDTDAAEVYANRQANRAELAPKHARRAARVAYGRYLIARETRATYYVPAPYSPRCAGNLANSIIGACPLCVPLLSLAQDEAHCYQD